MAVRPLVVPAQQPIDNSFDFSPLAKLGQVGQQSSTLANLGKVYGATAKAAGPTGDMARYAAAIARNESGGRYDLTGPGHRRRSRLWQVSGDGCQHSRMDQGRARPLDVPRGIPRRSQCAGSGIRASLRQLCRQIRPGRGGKSLVCRRGRHEQSECHRYAGNLGFGLRPALQRWFRRSIDGRAAVAASG